MRRLAVNWVLPDPSGPAPDYDAVAEDWFDDAPAMEAAFASPEGKAVVDDTPNFLDMSRFRLQRLRLGPPRLWSGWRVTVRSGESRLAGLR